MAQSKEELKAKVAELGITVTRHDGEEGEPTVNDYKAALSAYEAAAGAGVDAPVTKGREATFKIAGPLNIFGARSGQTVTGIVTEHEVTGEPILVVGEDWALLGPHLEAGWLEEVNS